MPSLPKWMSPPLWPPCRKARTISSLAGSIRGGSVFMTVKRETRVPSSKLRWRFVPTRDVTDEALAVLLKIGVEREAVDRLDLLGLGQQVERLDLLAQVEKQLGLGVRAVGEE